MVIRYDVLDELNRAKTIICVIEGDAPGADRLAGQWARRNHIDLKVIVPEYDQFGARLAPPLRNQRMLDEGKPDFRAAMERKSPLPELPCPRHEEGPEPSRQNSYGTRCSRSREWCNGVV